MSDISNADNITAGVGTDGEPSQEQVEVGSDHSDTGWETDLEIEGNNIKYFILYYVAGQDCINLQYVGLLCRLVINTFECL